MAKRTAKSGPKKADTQPEARWRRALGYVPAFLLGALLVSVIFALLLRPSGTPLPNDGEGERPLSLSGLLGANPAQLQRLDIAEMNLLCAAGLPGAEDLHAQTIQTCLARLDRWADRVRFETERHLYRLTDPRYEDHAEHYGHSEARFRAERLIDVLQKDIGLHYHAGFVGPSEQVPPFKT